MYVVMFIVRFLMLMVCLIIYNVGSVMRCGVCVIV